MKKVISFCLYGQDPRYTIGALKNAMLASEHMPDWECWFYVAPNVPEIIVDRLSAFSNVKIVRANKPFNYTFTMERFRVFSDPTVDIAIVRDTDARILARDILCINEWLAGDWDFSIIKDHPTGHSAVMSAGMWGARANAIRNISDELDQFLAVPEVDRNQRGVDQEFLGERIFYPIAQYNALYHMDFYTAGLRGNSAIRTFPSPDRFPDNHIGAAVDENDNYVYEVDRQIAYSKNKSFQLKYDFDLLEKND
jgi:hypothetical protein